MTALYYAHPYLAFEAKKSSVVQKRVIFAISQTVNPKWLSWYVFVEDGGALANAEIRVPNELPNDQGWDGLKTIGNADASLGPVLFHINTRIDVNHFSTGLNGGLPTFAFANFSAHDDRLLADLHLQTLPTDADPSQAAHVSLQFKRGSDLSGDVLIPRPGKLWLLGSVAYGPHAIHGGPASTAQAGHLSAYDRLL